MIIFCFFETIFKTLPHHPLTHKIFLTYKEMSIIWIAKIEFLSEKNNNHFLDFKDKKSIMKKVLPTPSSVSMNPKLTTIYFAPTPKLRYYFLLKFMCITVTTRIEIYNINGIVFLCWPV